MAILNSKDRKEREKDALQNKIFDTAVEIILTEGLEKLSIRRIASNIGYAPSTIYNYFKNKDDILDSIALSVYEEVVIDVQEVLKKNQTLSPKEQIRLCSLTFIQTMAKYPEKFRAVMLVSYRSTNKVEGEGSDITGLEILAQLILAGEKQGEFRKCQEDSAELILVGLMGFIYHVVSNNFPVNSLKTKKMAEHYVDMLVRSLE